MLSRSILSAVRRVRPSQSRLIVPRASFSQARCLYEQPLHDPNMVSSQNLDGRTNLTDTLLYRTEATSILPPSNANTEIRTETGGTHRREGILENLYMKTTTFLPSSHPTNIHILPLLKAFTCGVGLLRLCWACVLPSERHCRIHPATDANGPTAWKRN